MWGAAAINTLGMALILKGVVEGEVCAADHSESGNDLPPLMSTTRAEK